jgi:hypothetical protein
MMPLPADGSSFYSLMLWAAAAPLPDSVRPGLVSYVVLCLGTFLGSTVTVSSILQAGRLSQHVDRVHENSLTGQQHTRALVCACVYAAFIQGA